MAKSEPARRSPGTAGRRSGIATLLPSDLVGGLKALPLPSAANIKGGYSAKHARMASLGRVDDENPIICHELPIAAVEKQ